MGSPDRRGGANGTHLCRAACGVVVGGTVIGRTCRSSATVNMRMHLSDECWSQVTILEWLYGLYGSLEVT